MLDVNPETVQFIIDRAHEYQIRDELRIEDNEITAEDLSEINLDHEIDDPTFRELQSTIDDLEPDQQVCLVALMWIGRGDYMLSEWEKALEHAGDSWNTRAAEYLIRTPLLADYLSEGLEQFENVDDEES
jgi:hypothetical protein